METPVNERVKFLLDTREKGNKAAFGRALGISGQAVGDLLESKGGPSFPVMQRILKSYPDLSSEWLIFGQGPMLKANQSEVSTPSLNSGEATIEYAQQLATAGLVQQVINGQAKTIATQEAALETKDKLIAYLEEELKKFGGSSDAAYGDQQPRTPTLVGVRELELVP